MIADDTTVTVTLYDCMPHKFGARVVVDGKSGIEGVVTGWAAYPHATEVLVSWFANGDATSAWFADWRVKAAEQES